MYPDVCAYSFVVFKLYLKVKHSNHMNFVGLDLEAGQLSYFLGRQL